MKKYIYTILILIVSLFSATSCDEFLDLEPTTQLSSSLAFDNLAGIEAGINGVYSTIHSDWVERQWIFAEALSSTIVELNPINNSNYQDAINHSAYTDLFNTGNYLWRMSFNSIHLVNQVLQALPDIPEPDEPTAFDKRRLQGEALFLRGMMYFVLNRFWGQPQNGLSVPLLTEPILVSDKPARATIEEIKAQVISDLLEAERLMAGIHSNNNRATVSVVKALLARVYFEYEDYEKAADYADQIISSGRFSLLVRNFLITYDNTITSENIFSFLSINTDLAALNMYLRYTITRSNVVQLGVSPTLWATLENNPNDLRLLNLYQRLAGERRVTKKYDVRNMNLPYIRLPEMYLIRAESRANTGDLTGALADLNTLRNRSGLPPANPSNPEQLLDLIYVERTVEMALEGDYLHNHKRLKREVGGLPYEEAKYKLVFFLPEDEIRLNENLIQNDIW